MFHVSTISTQKSKIVGQVIAARPKIKKLFRNIYINIPTTEGTAYDYSQIVGLSGKHKNETLNNYTEIVDYVEVLKKEIDW